MKRYQLTPKALGTAPAPALKRLKQPSRAARIALRLVELAERACVAHRPCCGPQHGPALSSLI